MASRALALDQTRRSGGLARYPRARMSAWTELLIIVGLIAVNGVFAGAEIAVVSVRASRLRELAAAGNRAAQSLIELRSDPERFLSTIQVVITVVGAAVSSLALEPAADSSARRDAA